MTTTQRMSTLARRALQLHSLGRRPAAAAATAAATSSSSSSTHPSHRLLLPTVRHSSTSSTREDALPLPHMGGRPTDEEMAAEDAAAEGEESHMKDGLAIKMATSSFTGRRR